MSSGTFFSLTKALSLVLESLPGLDEKFEELDFLGKGSFGCVFLCRERATDSVCVIKVFPLTDEFQLLLNQIARVPFYRHEYVLNSDEQWIEQGEHGDAYCIRMEFFPHGSLRSALTNGAFKSRPRTIWLMFKRMLEGLHYLHQKGLVHGNLKPENVLLTDDFVPKIADLLPTGTLKTSRMTMQRQGASLYLAPELAASKFTTKSDMFSLGVIFFEVLFSIETYDKKQLIELIEAMKLVENQILQNHVALLWRISQPASADMSILQFFLPMLLLESGRRPSAFYLLTSKEFNTRVEMEEAIRKLEAEESRSISVNSLAPSAPTEDILELPEEPAFEPMLKSSIAPKKSTHVLSEKQALEGINRPAARFTSSISCEKPDKATITRVEQRPHKKAEKYDTRGDDNKNLQAEKVMSTCRVKQLTAVFQRNAAGQTVAHKQPERREKFENVLAQRRTNGQISSSEISRRRETQELIPEDPIIQRCPERPRSSNIATSRHPTSIIRETIQRARGEKILSEAVGRKTAKRGGGLFDSFRWRNSQIPETHTSETVSARKPKKGQEPTSTIRAIIGTQRIIDMSRLQNLENNFNAAKAIHPRPRLPDEFRQDPLMTENGATTQVNVSPAASHFNNSSSIRHTTKPISNSKPFSDLLVESASETPILQSEANEYFPTLYAQ